MESIITKMVAVWEKRVGEAITSEAGVVGKFNNNSYKWSKAMRASTGSDSGVIFEMVLTNQWPL